MSLNIFRRWGINPSGRAVNFQVPVATNGHTPMEMYSRSVTLEDATAISLPEAVIGVFFVSDGTDAAQVHVNADGTVVLVGATAGVASDASGNIQIGDVAADDSTQVGNVSGTASDISIFGFYHTT